MTAKIPSEFKTQCAPGTLKMMAQFSILSRLKEPENSSIFSKMRIYDGEVLKVELPMFIEATISHTEPGFKGDSSKAGTKPATNGAGGRLAG